MIARHHNRPARPHDLLARAITLDTEVIPIVAVLIIINYVPANLRNR
jgi:hypothetical protein